MTKKKLNEAEVPASYADWRYVEVHAIAPDGTRTRLQALSGDNEAVRATAAGPDRDSAWEKLLATARRAVDGWSRVMCNRDVVAAFVTDPDRWTRRSLEVRTPRRGGDPSQLAHWRSNRKASGVAIRGGLA